MNQTNIIEVSLIGDRNEQQDRVVSHSSEHCLFAIVSDGAGGLKNGAEAARAVISCSKTCWDDAKGNPADIGLFLRKFAKSAHQKVQQLGIDADAPRATLVAIIIKDNQVEWVHCGDSRLYRFSNCIFDERTKDHSVLQILVDQGKITDEEMGTHPDQGKLFSSLGGPSEVEMDFGKAKRKPSDTYLLCSDGFWEYVTVKEMEILVSKDASTIKKSLEQFSEKAIERANGDSDNVSASIIFPTQSKSNQKSIIKKYLSRLAIR